jgi:chromosome segregation ATPase
MDDIRDTRPWFWILIAAVLAVAVVGLVIAISANNSSVDEQKIVNEATAEIKEEVKGLNSALEAADEFSEESDKLAAEDRKRIKREVNAAVAGGQQELNKVKSRVKSLEGEASESQAENAKLKQRVADLEVGEEDLEAEIEELDERVTKLRNGTGG